MPHRICVISLTLALLASAVLCGFAGAEPASTQPATRPAEFPPDAAEALHKVNSADPSVIPTVLLWLGSEQDELIVGKGSPRLRIACHAVRRFQLKQAVPWLVMIYDNPTAQPGIREIAAETAIRVDPFYSFEFLRDVLYDSTLSPQTTTDSLGTAQRAAAGALASAGNEDARAIQLDAFKQYLDSLAPGRPTTGAGVKNYETVYELSRLSDPVLIDRVKEIRDHYPAQPALGMATAMLRQLTANMQPDEELLRLVRPGNPADAYQRSAAISALGHKAGPEVIEPIDSVRQSIESRPPPASASQPATTEPPATQSSTTPIGTTPTSTTQFSTTQPATRPAAEEELLAACRNATFEIQARAPVPVPDPPREPAATQPVEFPGEQDVPDDAELVRPERATVRKVNGVPVRYFIMYDPAGILPPIQAVVSDDAIFRPLQYVSYGSLARVKLSGDRAELIGIRQVPVAPGEAKSDGYTFVAADHQKEGQWDHLAIHLRKFGRETVALVPNRRHADGTYLPDAPILKAVQGLTPGQPVEAEFDPGPGPTLLSTLVAYRPPLAANFGRLTDVPVGGANRRAIEVTVSRKRKTFVLPENGTDPWTLDVETLSSLAAGTELKIVPLEGSQPAALSRVVLNSAVATRDAGAILAVRAGRVTYTGRREQQYRGSWTWAASHDHEIYPLRGGLSRYLNDKKNAATLTAEQITGLRQAERALGVGAFPASDVEAVVSLMKRWDAASAEDRPTIEKQLELQLLRESLGLSRHEEQFRRRVKELVTPAQYHEMIVLGQTRTVARDAAAAARAAAATRPADAP